jgi:hypothetical protein
MHAFPRSTLERYARGCAEHCWSHTDLGPTIGQGQIHLRLLLQLVEGLHLPKFIVWLLLLVFPKRFIQITNLDNSVCTTDMCGIKRCIQQINLENQSSACVLPVFSYFVLKYSHFIVKNMPSAESFDPTKSIGAFIFLYCGSSRLCPATQ